MDYDRYLILGLLDAELGFRDISIYERRNGDSLQKLCLVKFPDDCPLVRHTSEIKEFFDQQKLSFADLRELAAFRKFWLELIGLKLTVIALGTVVQDHEGFLYTPAITPPKKTIELITLAPKNDNHIVMVPKDVAAYLSLSNSPS